MSSSSDENIDLKPVYVKEEADSVSRNLLHENSKKKYLKAYDDFIKWRAEKRLNSFSESVFLSYFHELSEKLKPSSLWSIYSMLKSTLNTKHGIKFKDFTKLSLFLRRKSYGFKSKKSKVLNAQQVLKFLNEAPDEIYLATKVALIFGISGACRSNEIVNLKADAVEKHGQLVTVKLQNTETKIERMFVVQEEFSQLVQKYQALRPDNLETNRFFLNYQKGRCLRQVIGKNKFANFPKQIAKYLNLPNPELYTGHCFRRTSATLLADSGANLTTLKRQGGWKSSQITEKFSEPSITHKEGSRYRIDDDGRSVSNPHWTNPVQSQYDWKRPVLCSGPTKAVEVQVQISKNATQNAIEPEIPTLDITNMEENGYSFLDKVLAIVKEEYKNDVPLVRFEHPDQLKEILDLDVTEGTDKKQLEECVRKVVQYCVKTNKPTFKNQLFGAVDPNGLAGAWLAEACNTSQYTYEVAPAFTLIELQIIDHVLKKFGLSDGNGIFSPGGSLSMLYAVAAARYDAFPQAKTKGMRALPEMVIFTSEDSHYSVRKAAHWLGFGTDSIRFIKVNEFGQMVTEELELAIRDELEKSRHPLLVNATAGTTVLGAIDDLNSIADICKKYKIWMHVDACWGGSLILSSKHKNKLQGIQRADSISWNPHKMAGAPLQCSLFLVSKKELLHMCNSASAQYLFQTDKFYDMSYDTGDKSIQCGRKIDAFKLWMMWKARGDSGLSALLDRTMENAQFCMDMLATRAGFRLVSSKLQCPNICFWYIPFSMRGQQENESWWERLHKMTAEIKELLMVQGRLMIAYSPLRHHKNFFRLALTFHPVLEPKEITGMLQHIEECGEIISRLKRQ